jgi:putative transcriptional regulator
MESAIAPGFLVAAPHMRDPHFERTVVLMIEHDDEQGSFGLVVNRAAEIDLSAVLGAMQVPLDTPVDIASHPPILEGGPVSPELGWIVHSADWSRPETRLITPEVGVTASVEILKAISHGAGPSEYALFLGYAGWGPHQLIAEIRTGAWITVPFERDLVFRVPFGMRWEAALGRLGIDPRNIAPVIGDA